MSGRYPNRDDLQVRLAVLLEGLREGYKEDILAMAGSQEWGVCVEEVEFYLSAIASYNIRAAWKADGLQLSATYDRWHWEVFWALDALHGRKRGWFGRLWDRISF